MDRFKRFSVVATSLMLVLALGTVLGNKQVHAMVASMVQVVNNASNPVPNRDVDNPARQPYFFNCVAAIPDGFSYGGCIASIPTGKRLVIENVTGSIRVPPGQKILTRFTVHAAAGVAPGSFGGILETFYPAALQMPLDGFDYYALNQTGRIFADSAGGVDLEITVFRDSYVNSGNIYLSIVGYLVSL